MGRSVARKYECLLLFRTCSRKYSGVLHSFTLALCSLLEAEWCASACWAELSRAMVASGSVLVGVVLFSRLLMSDILIISNDTYSL